MAEKAKKIKIGPPLERETKMGALVSKEQYDRVCSYLEIGKKEPKVEAGGGRLSSQTLTRRPVFLVAYLVRVRLAVRMPSKP
jgi:acyl-CoA reductase-like NAD-dependent aldehyde dehydrogenase